MFSVINIIIVIITGKSHAKTCSWLQDDASQCYLVPFSNPNGWKYSVAQGLSSRFRSKYSMAFFGLFHPSAGFPIAASKTFRWSSSGRKKLWQCEQINIIGLKEWFRQKKNTDFESYILVKKQSLFKFSTIFEKNASKLQLRNVHFQQQKHVLEF